MKLLLHTCCAPCLIYPLEILSSKGFKVSSLFYNPNIHGPDEYRNRKQAVMDYSLGLNLEVIYPDYVPQEFFRAVNMMEERIERCPICWYQRLKVTAQIAKEKGFSHFTTTLLASPYQDQELLNRIGRDLAKVEGLEFYEADFREGFRRAHDQAKAKGIYCQKYCGCIYSQIERLDRKSQITNSKLQTNPNTK